MKHTSAPPHAGKPPSAGEMRAMNEALVLGAVHQHELAEIRELLNVRLQAEINERKQAQEALQNSDRHKTEFLAVLAHELRGPLAPLSNALELMQRAQGDATIAGPALEMARRQLDYLVRLVDDLLDANRIGRGKLRIRREHVELSAVVHQAGEACRPAIVAAQQELTLSLPRVAVWLDADPVRLVQVLVNLLTNACKYSGRGGRIALTAARQKGAVIVSVKDNGIGIAAAMLPKIFDLFEQVDQGLERSQGGLGVGLALVRRLVKMHGGTVEARSGGLGQGSEFVVRLPVIAQPAPAALPRVPAAMLRLPRRILVVDDNHIAALSLSMLLKHDGHEPRTAHDGEEAVTAAAEFRPDVVVLDIGLPRMNGYEAARRIRAEPWGKDIFLIALTGWGQDEDRRKSEEAGFDRHLVKPVDYQVLARLLAEPPKNAVDAPGVARSP